MKAAVLKTARVESPREFESPPLRFVPLVVFGGCVALDTFWTPSRRCPGSGDDDGTYHHEFEHMLGRYSTLVSRPERIPDLEPMPFATVGAGAQRGRK